MIPFNADIRPDTMNIDETKIEAAISEKTRAIVPVHYAGVACEMDTIMAIAQQYQLYVVEDAAHATMATYKGRALGAIGHLGCFSFHETKNYTSGGEGGATLINDPALIERADIIREKGTNRSQFFRGMADKYTWHDIGSSFLMADLQDYYEAFAHLANRGRVELPSIPIDCAHCAHIFYLKLRDKQDRCAFIAYLKEAEILATFHYIPLHSSPAGKKFGSFHGDDIFTTRESERLVRLPLFFNLIPVNQRTVINTVLSYFG